MEKYGIDWICRIWADVLSVERLWREKDMKLISWNVNGLRACMQKGFLDFFNEADADVFCLQETKMQEGQLELELPGYHQ